MKPTFFKTPLSGTETYPPTIHISEEELHETLRRAINQLSYLPKKNQQRLARYEHHFFRLHDAMEKHLYQRISLLCGEAIKDPELTSLVASIPVRVSRVL